MVIIVMRESATETILPWTVMVWGKGEKSPLGRISHVNEMYR